MLKLYFLFLKTSKENLAVLQKWFFFQVMLFFFLNACYKLSLCRVLLLVLFNRFLICIICRDIIVTVPFCG